MVGQCVRMVENIDTLDQILRPRSLCMKICCVVLRPEHSWISQNRACHANSYAFASSGVFFPLRYGSLLVCIPPAGLASPASGTCLPSASTQSPSLPCSFPIANPQGVPRSRLDASSRSFSEGRLCKNTGIPNRSREALLLLTCCFQP